MYCLLVLVLISIAPAALSKDCKAELCKPEETCCDTEIPGYYTCCPFENAVCCEDRTHCCPQGTQCDILTETCSPDTREQSKLHTLNKLEKRLGVTDEEVFSVDYKQDSCDSSQTCCPTDAPGGCNCCPFSNAVCCEGSTSCCPENWECDVVKGECTPKETTAGIEKRQGFIDEEGNVKKECGDGTICPYDTTCCSVAGGKHGCCPHLYATCCPDLIHCCAHDQVCDVTSRYCLGKQLVHESTEKESALPIDHEESS